MTIGERAINDFLSENENLLHDGLQKFAFLKLYVNQDNEELINMYKDIITTHNNTMKYDPYPNSGFDLFIPKNITFDKKYETKFVDLQIKTEMVYFENNTYTPSAFNVHPRSSMSKTPLMLANHTGIIDCGYRGSLIGALRWLNINNESEYVLEKNTRLLQICHPTLCRVFVGLVFEEELSNTTRGSGGFGSTGGTTGR